MTVLLASGFDFSHRELVSSCDELPLWSAPFGLKLLEFVPMLKDPIVVDIGCGTGFPLLELAQRFGAGARLHGIDPWEAALDRIRMKMQANDLTNIELHEREAESLPFSSAFCDLVVSNNGLNNVRDASLVMREIVRVLKPGGQLVFSVNLPGTMHEFYREFIVLLEERFGHGQKRRVEEHIAEKRKSLAENLDLIRLAGLGLIRMSSESFWMRFADGTAFLNYSFIRRFFRGPWEELVPSEKTDFFHALEMRLNQSAESRGEFSVSIPFACFVAQKGDEAPENHNSHRFVTK